MNGLRGFRCALALLGWMMVVAASKNEYCLFMPVFPNFSLRNIQ